MIYAVITGGVCANAIDADAEFVEKYGAALGEIVVPMPEECWIGDYYDAETGTWTKAPEPDPEPEPEKTQPTYGELVEALEITGVVVNET